MVWEVAINEKVWLTVVDSKIHILHVARVYGSRHGGSAYSEEMVRVLVQSGCKVTIIAEECHSEKPAGGLSFVRLPAFFRSGPRHWIRRFFDIGNLWRLALNQRDTVVVVQGDLPRINYLYLQLLRPLVFIRQDAILTCPANNRFLPQSRRICDKRLGMSCLSVHKCEGCFGSLSLLHRVGRIAYRWRDLLLLRLFRHFVVNSHYMATCHGREALVVYPPNLAVPQVSSDNPRILKQVVFCGRLEGTKGAEDSIRIMAMLPPDYTLEVLGDGPQREMLAGLSDELGLAERVRFRGWVTAEQRDAVLASSGVLLVPSLGSEAFGMVGIEAFTQGTPVVAYEAGGIPEWCDSKAGALVPCGDTKRAGSAIRRICDNPSDWLSYSNAARQVATKQFPISRFGSEMLRLINGVRTESNV